MRVSVVAACLSLCLIGFSSANDAQASIRRETNIPAEGLGPALNALAKDRNFQIVYVTEEIANVRTEGAVGEFTIEEALKQLLNGTGLTYRYLDGKTVTIGSATTPHDRSGRASKTTSFGSDDTNANQEGKKSSSGEFRMAQVDQRKNSGDIPVGNLTSDSQQNSNGPTTGLSEIIVTAQKRRENIQDVPASLSVVQAQTLVDTNQVRLEDYYDSVPGLNLIPTPYGTPVLAIRGIISDGSGGGDPTVSIMVDGVPYGASTALGGGGAAPDFDPSDLERIEVLRGPQGTLYGASSLGGLINYITVDPSTEAFSGRIGAGFTSVENGGQLGYNVRGAINVPVGDSLAIRASGYSRIDPGYIDDPVTGADGVNRVTNYGGRIALLWRPSDVFSIKLSADLQHSRADGSSYSGSFDTFVSLAGLKQIALPGTMRNDLKTQTYSATLTSKIGDVDLVSLSGLNINQTNLVYDDTLLLGACCTAPLFNGTTGTSATANNKTTRFSQEIRISSTIAQRIDWLLGGFYSYDNNKYQANLLALNPDGSFYGFAENQNFPTTLSEYAAFGDLTFHLTDRFDVQVGVRESENRQSYNETDTGPFVPLFDSTTVIQASSPYTFPRVDTKANAFTYLLTPRFKLSPDVMVYARLASGYRGGGPNTVPGTPQQYNPDKTYNYEIGSKMTFLDRRLSVDASIYYVDWKNVQVGVLNALYLGYETNGTSAKSQGFELSVTAKPVTGLTLAAWIDLNDAKLTRDFPAAAEAYGAYGVAGERLPYSARFSGNLSAEQDFPLVFSATGFVGAQVVYMGDRQGQFTTTTERVNLPAYAKTDLRAGVRYASWTVNAFLNNVGDRRGVLQEGFVVGAPTYFYITPRTVGLNVAKVF